MKRSFIIVGNKVQDKPDLVTLDGYTTSHAIDLTGSRDGGITHEIDADEDDIVEFEFQDDSFWMGTVGEIPLLIQNEASPTARDYSGPLEIPQVLSMGSDQRGFLRNVILKRLHIRKPAEIITSIIVKKSAQLLDAHIQESPGLYFVDKNFRTKIINQKLTEINQPYLLMIHGTAASLDGSFDKMIKNNQFGLWDSIQKQYGDRILALQHYTLSKSPVENAIEAIKWMPKNATLHIMSTSRGGLVGELIAKLSDKGNPSFKPENRQLIADAFGDANVKRLEDEISSRNITVEKFIRTACPAAGTSLCSKRLDRFLTVLINGIQFATVGASAPALAPFKKLVADILACKAKPDVLPGLYAMNPDSGFIKALNHPQESIGSPLYVIAGNNKISLKPKAFVTILSKLIFYGKNDWIVDTKSMTRGIFRKQNIGYFLDEGDDVNHFHYFANRDTQEAIKEAVNAPTNAIASKFESFDRNLASNADRGWVFGNLEPKPVSGEKPVIVMLPGILGSNLSKDGHEIYLSIDDIMAGKMTQLNMQATNVKATSLIKKFYGKFAKEFDNDYDVAVFPYDWRLDLRKEADRLNDYITNILHRTGNHSIKIVAHSMGGLVVRSFIQRHANTWNAIKQRSDYRVIFLGSPLGGSYLIPEIMVGSGGRIKQMANMDLIHSKNTLLEVFNKYDGLFNLLPADTSIHDFTSLQTWQEMKQNFTSFNWPIPSSATVNNYKSFHTEVGNFDRSVYLDKNIIYIAGKSDGTTNGFYYKDHAVDGDKLTFTETPYGDGSVTWESGIPAEIKSGDRVYYVRVGHGDLANETSMFPGIKELLIAGKTSKLSKNPPQQRGEIPVSDKRDELIQDVTPEEFENTMIGSTPTEPVDEEFTTPINVVLRCGDLKYATYPVLVGHLKGDGIMSAESVVDHYMSNMLTKRLATGNYPGDIGESKYFKNNPGMPKGTLIVGMGKTEKLSGFQLEETVKQGVIEYLCEFRVNEGNVHGTVGLSSLLLGCGYAGLSVETAVKAVISGVHKANQSVRQNGDNIWPTVDEIEFIEIYEDRALQALICLDNLKHTTNAGFNFEPTLYNLLGSRKRLLFEQNADWWQRVTIREQIDCEQPSKGKIFTFTSSMGTARDEMRKLYCTKEVIDSLMKEISSRDVWDKELAKTLFELMIPNDFKLALRNQQNLLLIVDETAAAYPWEMLQDISIHSQPLATTAGMIRQLTTENFRPAVNYTLDNTALIIGNPNTANFLPSLQGASDEAELVNNVLMDAGYQSTLSNNESSSVIIRKLFRSDYKIIHLAGHGVYNHAQPDLSGMVIGNNVFLTTREIQQLSFIPELVFINCCHLGNIEAMDEALYQNRYKLAANLGTQLINMGVKAVIAAGWAINDNAAKDFTEKFYAAMLSGSNFGDAVRIARHYCYEHYPYSNTWGAYQCYGDQFFTLKRLNSGKKPSLRKYYVANQVRIDLENLINRIGANYSEIQKAAYLDEINLILDSAAAANIPQSSLYECLGIIYNRLGNDSAAIENFKLYFEKSSETFNVSSYVEYARLLLSHYTHDKLAAKKIRAVVAELENLSKTIPSYAIFNAIGTGYKILARMSKGADHSKNMLHAYRAYEHAYNSGKQAGVDNTMYALSNAFMLGIALQDKKLQLPDISELEWSFNNIKAFDNTLTFWDLMDEPRYWLCKFVMQHQGFVFPHGNVKVKAETVIDAWEKVVKTGGMETQQNEMIAKFASMVTFFDPKKFSKLRPKLDQMMDALK
ncbi:MAG TPA: CHAT domain-containing protein [Chitinophagales bacterium]|nr:CHAT domain-containing protein [Chitinophagales bacterium]